MFKPQSRTDSRIAETKGPEVETNGRLPSIVLVINTMTTHTLRLGKKQEREASYPLPIRHTDE